MQYVVGVDGGGTKTAAAVLGEDLTLIGSATTGPANHRSVGVDAASANIASAINEALVAGGVALKDVSAICLCLAGFDTELDLPVPQRAIRLTGFTGPVVLENDVVGAWAAGTEASKGIVVIAGTGSTALGMNEVGQFWRTDGWDYVLGDSGSGYAVGLAGIRAAMKALDGRVPPTRIVRELADTYGVQTAEDMRRLWDGTRFGKFEIASFAAHVSEAAAQGDEIALEILRRAGRDLGEQAVAIIRILGMERSEFPVIMVGGVFKSGHAVLDPFRESIQRAAPGATIRLPLQQPQIGAAILALRRLQDNDIGSWTLGTGNRQIRRSLRVDEMRIP